MKFKSDEFCRMGKIIRNVLIIFILASLVTIETAICGEIWGFGAEFGPNICKFEGDKIEDTRASTFYGLCGGLFLDYELTEGFSLQPEILYSEKGAIYKYGYGETIIALNYLEIPLLMKVSFMEGNLKPAILVGPSCGILLRAKRKVENSVIPSLSGEFDATDEVKRFDFGWALEVGCEYFTGWGSISLGVRSVKSVVSNDDSGRDLNLRNRVFSVLAGVSIR